MQCFICVTYMIILCTANPSPPREITTIHAKRSLFQDVIESLRLHAYLPEGIVHSDNNDLGSNDDKFNSENEPGHLPGDAEYIPRRNDRTEIPPLKQRLPKSIVFNENDDQISEKQRQEVVVYIDSNKVKTTQKPKRNKQPTPRPVKVRYPFKDNDEDVSTHQDSQLDDNIPFSNTMSGQSQIGHRESQTVVKPTVIVNIRGSVNHRDSDIRFERKQDNTTNSEVMPQNIFNINQEINIQRDVDGQKTPKVNQKVKVSDKSTDKDKEDMMMCETATSKPDRDQENRQFDNVLQILFTI